MKKLTLLFLSIISLYGAIDEIEDKLKSECNSDNSKCLELAKYYAQKSDYDKSYKLAKKLCNKHNGEACIVAFYSQGQTEYNLIDYSCNKLHHGRGCRAIADFYTSRGNDEKAIKFLKKACKYGDENSCVAYMDKTGKDILLDKNDTE